MYKLILTSSSYLSLKSDYTFYSGPNADATAYTHAQFGPGSGPIYLDNVQCAGPELRLEDCFLDNNASECTHDEDASLRCSSTRKCT